jgi:hypothetical protein
MRHELAAVNDQCAHIGDDRLSGGWGWWPGCQTAASERKRSRLTDVGARSARLSPPSANRD